MSLKNDSKIISIAVKAGPELEQFSILNEGKIIYVQHTRIVRLLSEMLRLPYKIRTVRDGRSTRLPDGNWTGNMGLVNRSEVDLAVGSAALFEESNEVVAFSYPYVFSDDSFMTDKPSPLPPSVAFIYPFPLALWIILISVLVSFSLVIFLLTNREQSYDRILFTLLGSLLEKGIDIKIRKTRISILVCTWWSFAFIMTNSYKGILLSFLTLPSLTGIRDIPALAKAADQYSVTCYSPKGIILPQRLFESDLIKYKSVGKCLKRNKIEEKNAIEFFDKAPSRKAYVASRRHLIPYKRNYFISEDSFQTSMFSFPASRNFCCHRQLNKMIHRLFAAGVFQKIYSDEVMKKELSMVAADSNDSDTERQLKLYDYKGAFVILFSGYILALVCLLIELVVNRYKIAL